MGKIIYLSQDGLDALRSKFDQANEELKKLRADKAIAYTATGDTWHDNPYFNKLEQEEKSKMQEIFELSDQISNTRVFSIDRRNISRVQLGSIVHLHRYFLISGEEDQLVWEIVGFGETDVERKRVAYNAPMTQSLLGMRTHETIEVESPKGVVEYEILALFSSWDDVPEDLK